MAKAKKKGTIAWYKQESVEAFMRFWRGKPCARCKSTYMTVGHHLIGRGASPHHIVTAKNMIVLCPTHHTFSRDFAPHSMNPFGIENFHNWIKKTRPETWAWMEYHQHDDCAKKGKIPWIDIYEAHVEYDEKKKPVWVGDIELDLEQLK